MFIIDSMKNEIKVHEIEAVINHYASRLERPLDLTPHIDTWACNKQHIYQLFGNKLTIEKEIETHLSFPVVRTELHRMIDRSFSGKQFVFLRKFLLSLDTSEIVSNTLANDFSLLDVTFKRGIKVSKCFKSLIKKDKLHEVNVIYSMFLQSVKTKGIIVLSIDPKDYLTMSENTSGWSSCHSLDSDYAAGTLAYMLDNSTIIAYIKSSEEVMIGNTIKHTNKSWRQIVLVNPNLQYALQLRQYPNENDLNSGAVGEMMIGLLENWNKDRNETFVRNIEHVSNPFFNDLQRDHFGTKLYYNDVTSESFDAGYYIASNKYRDIEQLHRAVITTGELPQIVVGNDVPCVCGGCGENLVDSNYVMCYECRGESYCDNDDYYDSDN